MEHFSHVHPLVLWEKVKDEEKEYVCHGCHQTITSPYYRCNQCKLLLHKSCADRPRQLLHPIHPEHQLVLHAKPPNPYKSCICDACGVHRDYLIYHCSLCDFNIDLYCSSFPYMLENYGGHKHPLQLWAKKSSFSCDACNQMHSEPGISYYCATCRLRIHQECATLPSSTNHENHNHPLKFIYFDPLDYARYRPNCKICNRVLLKKSWIYGCADCKYLVHLKCPEPDSEIEDLSRLEEIEVNYKANIANVLHLPIAEKMDWIAIMFKQESLTRETDATEETNILSHEHGLTLLYDEEAKRSEICNGCCYPISTPFYYCKQCSFYLHKWCGELPQELKPLDYRYQAHEHWVKLIPEAPTLSGLFECGICFKYCNGFAYTCKEEEICEDTSLIDIKCATYPTHVKHEAHPHMLDLQLNLFNPCHCCSNTTMGLNFVCPPCEFTIDPQCASFPRSVWHKYDQEHPFILTYPHDIDPLGEYICEICKEDIPGSFWFYRCAICDLSMHIKCIFKVEDAYSNLRMGVTLDSGIHQHPVTLTKKSVAAPPCNHCGGYFDGPAFACSDCADYYLHPECAFK